MPKTRAGNEEKPVPGAVMALVKPEHKANFRMEFFVEVYTDNNLERLIADDDGPDDDGPQKAAAALNRAFDAASQREWYHPKLRTVDCKPGEGPP